MPVVFVIAEEWRLRSGVRAELREHGIKALGMETADEVGRALAEGESPSVIVLDANASAAEDAAIQGLVGRFPTVLIASRIAPSALQAKQAPRKVFFRPVQISEVVAAVSEILKGHAG